LRGGTLHFLYFSYENCAQRSRGTTLGKLPILKYHPGMTPCLALAAQHAQAAFTIRIHGKVRPCSSNVHASLTINGKR
jgi:hypothetical protein